MLLEQVTPSSFESSSRPERERGRQIHEKMLPSVRSPLTMSLAGADMNLGTGVVVVFFKYSIKSPGKHMIQGHRHKRLFISKNKVDFPPPCPNKEQHAYF